ncbi:hypothetical protein [Yinghuangia seranimata]|uniref:hypothetical protein n=1 Tax=Yinghuangia seranimata TaxID=408067 RepID=UPI00248A9BE7|nr:hypothetical protein [Yinghuangia seranimata]MDI2126092.1 hypothetical protein [Yinghuangia seranimata]
MPDPVRSYLPPKAEPESLAQLRGDCARIDVSWTTPHTTKPLPTAPFSLTAPAVHVPARGAELVAGLAEFGD